MKTLSSSIVLSTMLVASTTYAVIVDLTITGSWTITDYDVSSTGPDFPVGDPQGDDDLVFGVAPSDGSTTFTVRVDTDSASFYPLSYLSNGTDALAHDWYGYTDVMLVGTHTFGTASWETSDIVTGLVGVDGTTVALWTDADIAAANPTRVSFRMQGSGDDLTADLFVGARTPTEITNQFLLGEYFGGEEISSDSYSASSSNVPEPCTAVLSLVGIVGLNLLRRRR